MTTTEELLANAEAYAARFSAGVPKSPRLRVAVVACMDARLNPYGVLGLSEGDAHVIANAGGTVTDDVIRSLAVSQRRLGTEEILLLHHSDCGMLGFTHDAFVTEIEHETGQRPTWATETFADVDADVRQSMARIQASPFLPSKHAVRGFVFEVESGLLREVR